MERLTSVMDAASIPVFAADEDMHYVYENEAAERFLGYDRTEIIGKRLTDLVDYDPRLTTASFERLRRTGHLSGRVRYRHRDGSLRDAGVNAFEQTLSDGRTVLVSLVHPLHQLRDQLSGVLRGNSEYGFTSDQMRLLHLLADGFSDGPIASLLGHTEGDVAEQVQEIVVTMKVASRTEAVVLALKKHVVL